VYLPVVLLVIVLCTLFNLYSRIAKLIHIKQFQFIDDFTVDQINEGGDLLRKERMKWERLSENKLNDVPYMNNDKASSTGLLEHPELVDKPLEKKSSRDRPFRRDLEKAEHKPGLTKDVRRSRAKRSEGHESGGADGRSSALSGMGRGVGGGVLSGRIGRIFGRSPAEGSDQELDSYVADVEMLATDNERQRQSIRNL